MNLNSTGSVYEGKSFLIEINFLDAEDNTIDTYFTSGTVEALSVNNVLHLKRKDGHIYCIPFDKETITQASDGKHSPEKTGHNLSEFDFISRWDVRVSGLEDIDRIKKFGFVPDPNED